MEFKKCLSTYFLLVVVLLVKQISAQSDVSNFSVLPGHDITVIVDTKEPFVVFLNGGIAENVTVTFERQHVNLVDLLPDKTMIFGPSLPTNQSIEILGLSPGHLNIKGVAVPSGILDDSNLFFRVTVANSDALIWISVIVGWVYFAAWSISFYPQMYINFKRKSVVGLNFDFLSLNIVGFALYGLFNMGLFWSPFIEDEYFKRNPMGLNPVLINDVVFALHAMLATLVTIVQCVIYERAEQRVSTIARSILGLIGILVIVFTILGSTGVIHWLDFLYWCSYIKLSITLIKYIPQAIMNYKRKSTVGWSIGNILLDFTGGTLSMLQMMLNGYNYDDWNSIFGDLTKFGLGLFSVIFDIFFMVQHYILYRDSRKVGIRENQSNLEKLITSDLEKPEVYKNFIETA